MLHARLAALAEPERFLAAIRAAHVFHASNDPYLEHDFGQVQIDGDTVFWKIDYYALDSEFGSEAPGMPSKRAEC